MYLACILIYDELSYYYLDSIQNNIITYNKIKVYQKMKNTNYKLHLLTLTKTQLSPLNSLSFSLSPLNFNFIQLRPFILVC